MSEAKRVLRDLSEGIDENVIIRGHTEIRDLKKDMESKRGSLRNARKRMEESGVDLKAYDLAMTLGKLEVDEAITRLQRASYILQSLHSPLGSQLSLIGLSDPNVPVSPAEREKRWFDEGANAAINGKAEKECPHDPAMPAGQAWLNGYRDAYSKIVKAKTEEEISEAENVVPFKAPEEPKRGRGRPKGSGKKNEEAAPPPADPAPDEPPAIDDFDAPPPAPIDGSAPPPPPMFD